MTPPSHRPSLVATAVLLALVLVPYTLTAATLEDELNTVVSAARMVQGQVLYRDFFDYTAPLPNWLAAGVFLLTGPSILAVRVLQAIALWIAGMQLYTLGRRLGVPPWQAMLPPLGVLLVLYRIWPGYSHHWLVLPFVWGAVLAALAGTRSRQGRHWALAGVATGGACLCLQSDGPVLAISQFALLLLLPWLAGWPVRLAARRALQFLAGLSATLGLAALVLAGQGALGAAWQDAWVYLLTQYNQGNVNVMPFATDLPAVIVPVTPGWSWYGKLFHFFMLYALLPGVALGAIAWALGGMVARWRGQEGPWDEARLGTGLVGLLAVGFAVLACRGRADFIHVAQYSVPALLLASLAAARCTVGVAPGEMLVARVPLALLLAFNLTGAGMLWSMMRAAPQNWLRLESPDARLAAQPDVVFLREHTAPGDTILVAPYGGKHYLFARPPASRYTLFLPPLAGYMTPGQLQEVYEDIANRRPRYVIYAPWANGEWIVKDYRAHPLPGYREIPAPPGFPAGTAAFERVDAR